MSGKTSHIERVQSAIDYIEAHLRDRLDIHDLAYSVGYSASHFQRLFQALSGHGVAEYIRRRRLTEAFLEISRGERRILDLALDFQFESQESFTRAFKACFGITPGQCRGGSQQPLTVNGKHRITIQYLSHLGKGTTMTPKIIDMDPFCVIGIEAKFISILSPDKTNDAVIPKLWADFSGRFHQIRDRVGDDALGLIYCLDDEPKAHPNECLYICAVKVAAAAKAPSGMIRREVPGGKYAMFTHQGPAETFQHTMNYIYGSWFPKSGYEFDDRPEIEVYADGLEQDSEPPGWDICIPIR
jgi:AraC family transcriptional regulator